MLDKFKDKVFLEEYRTSPKYEYIRKGYFELYKKYDIVPRPVLFSKLRMFSEQGLRGEYEVAFNEHINKLELCAYMAIFYEDEKYLRELEDCIYDVLNMYVWALSAHIPDINEENYYELDLASCAIGSTFAVIYTLIGDRLHPQLRKRIVTELKRRILEPFKSQIWHWEDRYNNWTSVCAGFTGITLMLMFPTEFDALLPRFSLNMEKYFKGFPDDGVCLEGPGYWGYGFVSFLVYALLLKEYTKGEIDYFKLDKTKKIANFYQNTMLSKDVITSYGDCPTDVKTNSLLLHALKGIYGNDFTMPKKSCHADFPINPIIHILYFIEYYNENYINDDELEPYECYMEYAGWYIKRTNSYAIGAKGGSNGESHNHNDVGSFVFCKDNKQVLVDMGGRPYTKDYFTDARYDYLEPSSRGHNVPIINGQYQICIGNHATTKYENGIFSVDFKTLYNVKELESLVRYYDCREDSVVITDKFKIKGDGSFISRFVTFDKPIINDGEVIVDNVKISFDKTKAKASYTEEIHTVKEDASTKTVETCVAYLINIEVFDINDGVLTVTIKP